jgi:hypothetical protein
MSRKWHQQRLAESGETPAAQPSPVKELLDAHFGKPG